MKTWRTGQRGTFWLAAAVAAGLMVLIFAFSAQTAEQSSVVSGAVTEVLRRTLFQQLQDALTRKLLGHMFLYCLLGVSLLAALRLHSPRLWGGWAMAGCALYAAGDEFHQRFVPGRGAQWQDVCLDSLGALAGILLCMLFFWLAEKRQRGTKPQKPQE